MNDHDEFAIRLKTLEEGRLEIDDFEFKKLNRLQIEYIARSIEYRRTQEIQRLVNEINTLKLANKRIDLENKEFNAEKARSSVKLDEIKNGLQVIEKKLLNADVQYKNMQGDLRLQIHQLQNERDGVASRLTLEMSKMLTGLRILQKLTRADTDEKRDVLMAGFAQTADVILDGDGSKLDDLLKIFMVLFGD